jgi:hypothetical protein
MPVIRTTEKALHEGNRPPWCQVTSAGIFRIPLEGARFDRHYHDFHEYWLIFQGKAKVLSEGKEYYVKAGDILCTEVGQEHDILEIYEEIGGFWFEDPCPEGGRVGHLHRDEEKAKGHPVPALPVPADFPS